MNWRRPRLFPCSAALTCLPWRCLPLVLGLLTLCLFGPERLCAAEPDPLALLRTFHDNNADLRTLVADFRQEKHLQLLADTLESSGRMCVRRTSDGDVLLWEYTAPEVSGFVCGKEDMRVWLRDRSAIRPASSGEQKALGAMSAQVLAWLQADPDRLKQAYDIAYLPPQQDSSGAVAAPSGVRLAPRRGSPFFSAIEARFSPGMDTLHSLRLIEQQGDTTLLFFTGVARNVSPPPFCLP